ncbi:hypothetical protein [Sphingobium boeckii]|uniref:Uncharacterized protein n=1 Tax=Sphingobium boeckii TaxID=1082345 RepID=A0A7W9AJI0_9SPHN|nr:hypothetical protein [Sphingobium boeckii]MBB5686815.1 hypothetical protein [Sphingobium boeckii]
MAYRAFDVETFDSATRWETNTAEATVAARFTALEARVIAMADHDRLETGRPPSRIGRALDAVFGIKRTAPLADPKLEALRRFTVIARLAEGRLPEREIETFTAAGFSPLQARALQLRAAATHLFAH